MGFPDWHAAFVVTVTLIGQGAVAHVRHTMYWWPIDVLAQVGRVASERPLPGFWSARSCSFDVEFFVFFVGDISIRCFFTRREAN